MSSSLYQSRIVLSTAAVLLGVFAASCGDSKSEANSNLPDSGAVEPVTVGIVKVEPEPFRETILLTGYVKAVDDAVISTEEGGTLRRWEKPRGAVVEEGEILALLSDDVLRPMYESAKAQYEIADLTYRKQLKVYEEQGISEVALRTTQYTRDAAKAQMDLAYNRLERTKIRSPFHGVLDERFRDEGELAPPGSPIARVVSLSRMNVLVNVPESQAGIARRGSDATVTLSAYPGESFTGRITFVGAAVIADNRTVPVEIAVQNTDRRFKPDMIARVLLSSASERPGILIPQNRVHRIDQNTQVVYLEHDGRVERRPVTTGIRSGDRVQIVEGLSAGDHLIVSGPSDLYDGLPVVVDRGAAQ